MSEEEGEPSSASKQYEWSAHYDDDGSLYYYNESTQQSAWEAPKEGFNPPPNKYEWSAHYDDDGNLYYYNEKTQESSWEAPKEGFNPPTEKQQPNGDDDFTDPSTKEQADAVKEARDDTEMKNVNDTRKPNAEETENWTNMDVEMEETSPTEKVDGTQESSTDSAQAQESAAVDGDSTVDAEATADADSSTAQPKPSQASSKQYDWSAYYDNDGKLYYYNEKTQESAWEPPKEAFNPPEDAPAGEQNEQSYDWSAQYDDDGNLYYHNTKTGECAREPPEEGFNPPETDDKTTDAMPENETTDKDEKPMESQQNTVFEWSAHYDDDGNLYYHNAKTGESAWEPPEGGFNPPEAVDTIAEEAAGDQKTVGQAASDEDTPWVAYKDEEGQEYYYNQETGETQWDKPAKYKVADEKDDESMEAASVTTSPELEVAAEKSPSPEPEPEIDPAVKKLQDAEKALNRPDSVLEPSVMESVLEIVHANNNNPAKAIAALIDSYNGQTAVCGLLSKWLIDLETPEDTIRENIQNVINKIAKERFTKEAADGILDLSKSEAAFLSDMMDSSRWRQLLIDLTATHKDSALLLYCLRAISKRGHHREIAKRINQSEHFAVFNAMLSSELSVLGSQAVSAGSDIVAAAGLEELVWDLRRSCSATSYTYVYSIQLLQRLVQKAKQELKSVDGQNENDSSRFRRAIRKWESFSEILGSAMIDPSATQSVAGSSPLFRKRRLDVALTVSDLHQHDKRLRRAAIGYELNGNGPSEDLKEALSTLLRRYSMGVQVNDEVLDKLLPSGLNMDTRGVGELLIQHPLAVRALLGYLYKPGSARVASPSAKNKCAHLLALASVAAERAAKNEANEIKLLDGEKMDEETTDELALTRMIVQGSQLCEQLETVVSFLVTTDSGKPSDNDSLGQTLCDTALKCAPVGLGVVMWAREFTQGADFASLASFATLSPSILSLVRLIAVKHPFARADALHVGLSFLGHSNRDVSTKRVYAIKEASLRLLLFLLVNGDVVPVFAGIMKRLESVDGSGLDATLLQYFIAGVLEIVKPPVSPLFVRMFCRLLSVPKASDAVRSSFFSSANKNKLSELLSSFKEVRLPNGEPLGDEDRGMIVLLSAICNV